MVCAGAKSILDLPATLERLETHGVTVVGYRTTEFPGFFTARTGLPVPSTADTAVDWHQGLEFYAAALRLGKEVILLSYPDEPHHLARRENQKDFQTRMKQFFDHYLKGTPAPTWMTDGVPQVKKGQESAIK